MASFKFKQFSVEQDRCAMKIGTDGVLLGAWASLKKNPFSILDIGAGTGIISLMLAQRSSAELIDAIEIDENAYEQCVENFENSAWADRLFCYHASLTEFTEEIDEKYDLIISNPPFHEESYTSPNDNRNKARFTEALPFKELIESVTLLLNSEGIFSVIIPSKKETDFVTLAMKSNLFPQRITRVKGNQNASIKRSLIEFGFNETKPKTTLLILEKERHQYTQEYLDLVKDFYLKM